MALTSEQLRKKQWRREVKRRRERFVKAKMYHEGRVKEWDQHKLIVLMGESIRAKKGTARRMAENPAA